VDKYMLMYAANLAVPPGSTEARTEMVQCKSLLAVVLYLARNKPARAALAAGRFQLITVTP